MKTIYYNQYGKFYAVCGSCSYPGNGGTVRTVDNLIYISESEFNLLASIGYVVRDGSIC